MFRKYFKWWQQQRIFQIMLYQLIIFISHITEFFMTTSLTYISKNEILAERTSFGWIHELEWACTEVKAKIKLKTLIQKKKKSLTSTHTFPEPFQKKLGNFLFYYKLPIYNIGKYMRDIKNIKWEWPHYLFSTKSQK